LIYGNVLFYSEKNDCGDVSGALGLYYIMLFLIIYGYFIFLIIFLVVFCLLPVVLLAIRSERNRDSVDGRHLGVSNT
jgi:hypothetical protein